MHIIAKLRLGAARNRLSPEQSGTGGVWGSLGQAGTGAVWRRSLEQEQSGGGVWNRRSAPLEESARAEHGQRRRVEQQETGTGGGG